MPKTGDEWDIDERELSVDANEGHERRADTEFVFNYN